MVARIRSEFYCLEQWDKNSSVWKNKRGILMYGRITQEFKCLKRWDKNSNVSKDKIRMLLFGIQR